MRSKHYVHGMTTTYGYGCRCKDCTAAAVKYQRDYYNRIKKHKRVIKHGTTTGYNYGCRCLSCRKAVREYQRKYYSSIRKFKINALTKTTVRSINRDFKRALAVIRRAEGWK